MPITARQKRPKPSLGTVLVTGGCGFLGSHVVEALLAEPECEVVVVSRQPSQSRFPNAEYLSCDLTDHKQISTLLDTVNPRVIIHTITPGAFAPARTQYRVNYLSTKYLLDCAVDHRSVQAFVYTGSADAIANSSGFLPGPLTEADAKLYTLTSGPHAYARTKGAASSLVLESNKPHRASDSFTGYLRTTVLHIPSMYGPRDPNVSTGVLNLLNTSATRFQIGKNVPVHEWLYADNAGQAHVLAAKALLEEDRSNDMRVDGEAFFLSDGEPMKIWNFSRKLWVAAGDTSCADPKRRIIVIPQGVAMAVAICSEWIVWALTLGRKTAPFTPHHIEYMLNGAWWSIQKARDRLGYEPLVGTEEGIRRTAEWWLEMKRDSEKLHQS